MRCPNCGFDEDKVVDTRESREGAAIRRRRECLKCGRRFTTYEEVEDKLPLVVKKDGRRESFNREKILSGLRVACEKRPVSTETLEGLVSDIEKQVQNQLVKEVSSKEIGTLIMERLLELDEVAYVRFASVYKQFKDVGEFTSEIKKLKE